MPFTSQDRKQYCTDIRRMLLDIKSSKGCAKCPEKRGPCLEFHHPEVRNGKEKGVADMVTTCSLERIIAEALKCTVLCANCHKMEHWNEEELNYTKLHGTLA